MKVKNKNKSKDGELHKCDFCGVAAEELWSGVGIEGQYCFEHFRLMHEDLQEFDDWNRRFNEKITNSNN